MPRSAVTALWVLTGLAGAIENLVRHFAAD